MKRKLKIGTLLVGCLLLGMLAAIYSISSYQLNKHYTVPLLPALSFSNDAAILSRGKHLATSIGNCTNCHGNDPGGKIYLDAGSLGVVVGPNLTRGKGGIGKKLTDADWIGAIRYGISHKGSSLLVMPAEMYAHLTAEDLTALIVYLKQLPPINR